MGLNASGAEGQLGVIRPTHLSLDCSEQVSIGLKKTPLQVKHHYYPRFGGGVWEALAQGHQAGVRRVFRSNDAEHQRQKPRW
ncbi:unnamed protein product [Rangifer tarandus platyrhynchus]|uniref:Uncharacterized protein n=1 Tax=Rangifer tarandus platyrhynchus TaxID=3082113 RepID=A0AC59YLZ5_RANTA